MAVASRWWRAPLAAALGSVLVGAVLAQGEPSPLPPAAQLGAEAAPVLVRAVRFTGHTRLSDAELQAVAAPFLGRPLRALELEELRQRVTRAYVERGFVNSGAQLDAGALDDGTLTLRIVEGVITRVRQTGLGRLSPDYLSVRLADPAEPLDLNRLQERFQLQLADPLFERLNARLLPGDAPGRSLLDVEVTRARPWQLALVAHNHAAPAVGSDVFGVEGTLRNLTGWGDRLGLVAQRSGGSLGGDAAWTLPLGARRTLATLRLAHTRSSVIEEPLADLDIDSVVSTREASLLHPFVDEARQRMALGLAHSLRRNRTRLGGEPFALAAGDPSGRTQVEAWRAFGELTLRLGPHLLAAQLAHVQGRTNAPPAAEPVRSPAARYGLWQAQARLAVALGDGGSQLVARAQAQHTRDALVPLEQMAVGGHATVRGFRENRLVRDRAWALSTEWHWPLWRDDDARAAFTLVPFVDAGAAANRGAATERLSSAGLGLLARWAGLELELFVAHRLEGRNPADGVHHGNWQDHGIHLLVRWQPPL